MMVDNRHTTQLNADQLAQALDDAVLEAGGATREPVQGELYKTVIDDERQTLQAAAAAKQNFLEEARLMDQDQRREQEQRERQERQAARAEYRKTVEGRTEAKRAKAQEEAKQQEIKRKGIEDMNRTLTKQTNAPPPSSLDAVGT